MIPQKKPAVPIKLERWFNDLASVNRLREIVNDPVFQQAVAILKEAAGPSAAAISPDPQVNSHRLSWFAGYRDSFNDLEKLTKKTKSANPPTAEEWTHILNP